MVVTTVYHHRGFKAVVQEDAKIGIYDENDGVGRDSEPKRLWNITPSELGELGEFLSAVALRESEDSFAPDEQLPGSLAKA